MRLKVLIADDEALARDRLRKLLAAEPSVELVAECASGLETLRAIHTLKPDLVFLDVKMPELDGFEVLGALNMEARPVVVFVTAHDQFALKAFETHAVDYLLKPFDRERFQKAFAKACLQARSQPARLSAKTKESIPHPLNKSEISPGRFPIRTGGKIVFINHHDIDWISSADNYAELHVGHGSHLMRQTLTVLEKDLPEKSFIRISRSTIVNLDRIKEISPKSHGDYTAILKNGVTLSGSRNYRKKLLARLGH